MVKKISIVAALLAGGCGQFPHDVEGTSDRVARTHVIRIGIAGQSAPEAQHFIEALAKSTSARPELSQAALDTLIDDLNHERIDLIVTPVRADALLAQEVALSPPLDGSDVGDRQVQWRAAARNGENKWIMQVEHTAREGTKE